MAERNRPHIIVPMAPNTEPFTLAPTGGGGDSPTFQGDRQKHGQRLIEQYQQALAPTVDEPARDGDYISFASFPGLEIALESLDVQRSGEQPELVAVQEVETPEGLLKIATVYIPDGKKEYFLNHLTKYVETSGEDRTRHAALVDGIQAIRRATIRELWTDSEQDFPSITTERRWWEMWLRKRDGHELERLTAFADQHELRTSEHYLGFGDRTVVLLEASADQIAEAFLSLDDIAELRAPQEVATFLGELPPVEQAEWVDDVRRRLRVAPDDAPVVCILDRGVQDSHPLLAESIDQSGLYVADPSWQVHPIHPHGTEMAGLALYGDLRSVVVDSRTIQLNHRLESVKILPDCSQNDRELYGAITARAVDQAEIQSVERPGSSCLP